MHCRLDELLGEYPERWPLTAFHGNTLSLEGLRILDDAAGGEVNHYDHPPTDKDLIDELDCQESSLAL